MNRWIDDVLLPWVQARRQVNPAVVPLLLLDSYRVHMMGTVMRRIQDMGVVDVGINRPIKKAMSDQWEEWMYSGGGMVDGVAQVPTRALVAHWVIGTYQKISQQTGRNAWMKKGYEYF